jgi:magnesium chelatase family protein
VRARVQAARTLQRDRYTLLGLRTNAEVDGDTLEATCGLEDDGRRLLAQAAGAMRLTARGFTRVLRVSRTIADLAGATTPTVEHVAFAALLRGSDSPGDDE